MDFAQASATWGYLYQQTANPYTRVRFHGTGYASASQSPSFQDFYVDVYWVRFETPK